MQRLIKVRVRGVLALLMGTVLAMTLVSATLFSAQVHAQTPANSRYQTYVIATYGGQALLPVVRDQLASSRDGGSVSEYQGQLILRTTPANHQQIQAVLRQIDTAPQSLMLSMRVGQTSEYSSQTSQGQIVINRRVIQASGQYGTQSGLSQQNSLYQVQTLSGYPASISTATLQSLAQTWLVQGRSYARPLIVIQGSRLVEQVQGIAVTPRLLPDGQVQVQLSQRHDEPSFGHTQPTRTATVVGTGQSLNTSVVIPRGQWVSIGYIDTQSQQQATGWGQSQGVSYSQQVPIQIRVE